MRWSIRLPKDNTEWGMVVYAVVTVVCIIVGPILMTVSYTAVKCTPEQYKQCKDGNDVRCNIDPGDCPIWKSRGDCVESCKVYWCDLKCDPKAMYNAGLALTIIGSVLGGIVVI